MNIPTRIDILTSANNLTTARQNLYDHDTKEHRQAFYNTANEHNTRVVDLRIIAILALFAWLTAVVALTANFGSEALESNINYTLVVLLPLALLILLPVQIYRSIDGNHHRINSTINDAEELHYARQRNT